MIVYSGQNGRRVTASDGRTATVEKGSGAASETIRLTGVLHPDEKMVIDYDAGIDQEMYEDSPSASTMAVIMRVTPEAALYFRLAAALSCL